MTGIRKICIISTVHPASDVRIFHKQAKTLVEAGYEVVLIGRKPLTPIDEPNIKFRELPAPKNRFDRMVRLSLIAFKWAWSEQADVYHFHDPELIPVGIVLKLKGKKVIYDVHEDVPKQILIKYWIPSFLRRTASAGASLFERIGSRFFDGIVAATPTIARKFPCGKTAVVQNFPILNELVIPDAMPYSERPNDIAYVGGITAFRGIREMIQAVEILPDTLKARLCLAGAFSPAELYDDISAMPGWERVEFLGWQTREQVAALLGRVRVGLILSHPAPSHYDALPTKLFEYMSAGIPVIASDFPLLREIVEQAECGLVSDPLDPCSIASAIEWLLNHPDEAEAMGKRGQQAVSELYNWEHEGKLLISFYERFSK